MSVSLSEPSKNAQPEPIQNSHSTISERMSSEENELQIRPYGQILNDFCDEDQETLERLLSYGPGADLGQVDLEFAFSESSMPMVNKSSSEMRKTSFFYVKKASIHEKSNQKMSFSSAMSRSCDRKNSRMGTLQSRRVSILAVQTKDAKHERIENLAKIQSDLISRMYKKNEKSFNFVIYGRKYKFAENSWFLFDERNEFRKKVILFFKSRKYQKFLFLICVLNLIGFSIYDYSFRIGNDVQTVNMVSWMLEILCTLVFTVDFLLRSIGMGMVLGKGSLLRTFFGSFYFLVVIASWMVYLPESTIASAAACVRLLRIFQIVIFIKPITKNMNSLLNSLPNLMKTYMSMITLMIFYSILGLHLLKGMDENRCRLSDSPANGTWPADESIKNLCGEWECPENTYCINPSDFGFLRDPNENVIPELNYGLTNFNHIFSAFFTVLHFIDTIGWTPITYNFWKTINQVAAALFFTSLVIFGALIFMNILLATLYENFIEKESIKHSLEKKLKQQAKTKKEKDIQDLSFAKTLRHSPTSKTLKSKMTLPLEKLESQKSSKNCHEVNFSNKFLSFVVDILTGIAFKRVVFTLLVCDFVFLSLDRYPISHKEEKVIYFADFAIFWLFFIEILLKALTINPKTYFKSMGNIFEILIISANLIQYIYELIISGGSADFLTIFTKSGPLIRISKLARIYIILYSSVTLKKISLLINALFSTLEKIKWFMLFVGLLTTTGALIGSELFAYKVRIIEDGKETTPRVNYDSFFHAVISVILAFMNEEWNLIMYEIYESAGSKAIIFYMFLIVVGQMTFIVLLKALILNYFIRTTSKQFFEGNQKFGFRALTFIKSKMKTIKKDQTPKDSVSPRLPVKSPMIPRKSEIIKPLKRSSWKENSVILKRSHTSREQKNMTASNSNNLEKSIDVNSFKFPNQVSNDSELDSNVPSMSFNNGNPPKNEKASSEGPHSPACSRKKTMMIIPEKRKSYQIFLQRILMSKYYQLFMFLITLMSMVLQTVDSTFDPPQSKNQMVILNIERVLTLIYLVEFLMNALIFGLAGYLKSSLSNKLDFCNVVISICDIFIDKSQTHAFQILKIVRTFRILKLATTSTEEIQLISKAFIETLPNLMVLIIFFLIFLSISALIATKYVKGTLFHCEINSYEGVINDKWDCFDAGGDWIDEDINYNNVLVSIMSLFHISSSQGWIKLMLKIIDGRGVDLQPKEDANPGRAVLLLIFFFISNFIMLNMFVGIIIENIIINKNRERGLDILTEEQREWAIIKANILKMKPKRLKTVPGNNFKRLLFLLLESKYVNYLFDAAILLNLFIIMSYHHRQSPSTTILLNCLNYLTILIFTLENLMKLFLNPKAYFQSKKCLYESFILILILLEIIIHNLITASESHIDNPYTIFAAIVKGLQATRIYRIFKRFQSVKQIYDTLFNVMPTFLNMLLLIIILLYMYAIVGMGLFSYLKPQKTINVSDVHFRTFPIAFFTLVRVASSETWFLVFSDAVRVQSPNFVCKNINTYTDYEKFGLEGCGSPWAYPYFLSFHILFSLVILNLFVAIVLTQYDDEFKAHQSAINKYQLTGIKEEWRQSDPNGDGYINYKDFWRFSSKMAGFLGIQQSVESKKKFLRLLRIPVYENAKTKVFSYKFHDVIIELSKMSVLANYGVFNLETEEDFSSEFIETEEKSEGSKKKGLFTKTRFFCGDMSSIILISKLIRNLVKKAKKQHEGGNDIFDITKIAMMRRKTEIAAKLKVESIEEEDPISPSFKNLPAIYKEPPPAQPGAKPKKEPDVSNMYLNIMNEVTIDESSGVLSGNRSNDTCNRLLVEEGTKRRASILKKQFGFNEEGSKRLSFAGSPHKRGPTGKKIQFALD